MSNTNANIGHRGQNTSRAAKLPGLPAVRTGNAALDGFLEAVRERLEVRDGSRGDPYERAVTVRDLVDAGLPVRALNKSVMLTLGSTGAQQGAGGGGSSSALDGLLGGSMLFTDLLRKVQELRSNDDLPERVKQLVETSIAHEAKLRGADIRHVTQVLQSEVESFSSTLSELTASVSNASAGVREVQYASATANRSTAGQLTQLVAALDGGGEAGFSESIQVIADRMQGLRSQWMLRLNAGGAVSGISLLASEDPTGASVSAFVVEAGKFVVAAPVNFSSASTPVATSVGQIWYRPSTKSYFRSTTTGTGGWAPYTPSAPFGVDALTGTVYINGQLRVNAAGGTLQDLAAGAGRYTEMRYRRSASQPATPTGAFPSGWTVALPATGVDPVYMVRATKNADGSLYDAWSTPALAFKDGAAGAPGAPGAPGARGSLTGYGATFGISSAVWSDAQANAVILNMVSGATLTSYAPTTHLRIGDTVTLSNATFAATRYWGGSAWLLPGVVIDGNLLVRGSVSADSVDTRGLTIKDNAGNIILGVNAQLGTTYIKDAAIGTLKLAAGAATTIFVNAPTETFTPAAFPGSTQIAAGNINRSSGNAGVAAPMLGLLNFVAERLSSYGSSYVDIVVKREADNTAVHSLRLALQADTKVPVTTSFVDFYEGPTWYRVNATGPEGTEISAVTIALIEAKR